MKASLLLATLFTSTLASPDSCPDHWPPRPHLGDANGIAVPLTNAANDNGALCLDGSTPQYYWRVGNATQKFQIYFEGAADGVAALKLRLHPAMTPVFTALRLRLDLRKAIPHR